MTSRLNKIVGIEIRHVLVRLGIGRHLEVGVDAEHLPDGQLHVGQAGDLGIRLRVRASSSLPVSG